MEDINKERLGLGRRTMDSSHNNCIAHSGMNARLNIMLGLSGLACALIVIALNLLINISSDNAVANSERTAIRVEIATLKASVGKDFYSMDERLKKLEQHD